jgi:hypothetical protein
MRFFGSLAIVCIVGSMGAGNLMAQTGPWTDGEIIARSTVSPSGQGAFFRVVPETGATAVLTIPQYWGGWSGSAVFDSFRGGLLSNMSMPPDGTFVLRLWLVAHDGTATAMPGFMGNLRALASAGDGRVFFLQHTGGNQGPTTIQYFDSGNAIQTLKQSDGVTPFQADVEHLLYHAPSNALIGCSSAQWAATHCAVPGSSLYRIPLSADGLRVDAPVTCTSVSAALLYGDIMALDHLPDGNVLVTTATGFPGAPHRMLTVNPVTLAVASWAEPAQGDINGGIWSARVGKAVIHANSGGAWWEPSGLRTFAPGQTGFGGVIATSIPLPAGGGFSPEEMLCEVDLNGPACQGLQLPYGTGLAGLGNAVPTIGAIGCPGVNSSFTIAIGNVLGGASGLLAAGFTPGAIPIVGGTLYVDPIAVTVPVTVNGAPGIAGVGSFGLPVLLADPALIGVTFYLQAGFADAGAVQGFSLTNGLQIVIG